MPLSTISANHFRKPVPLAGVGEAHEKSIVAGGYLGRDDGFNVWFAGLPQPSTVQTLYELRDTYLSLRQKAEPWKPTLANEP